jgi:hypothetical protein
MIGPKKSKAPKLVVDNAPHDPTDESDFPYEEFLPIANRVIEFHRRFPELDSLCQRSLVDRDMALSLALLSFQETYWDYKDFEAEQRRKKLKLARQRKRR